VLAELHVDNLLLIASAKVEFTGGLNAFTGETGAGKSLLVDALNFLLGARGDAGMVRPGAEQAEVSARFILSDPELIDAFTEELGIVFEDGSSASTGAELVLSRTLPKSGRPRAHANGRPIALAALKDLGERLLDIHGQHENQSLLRRATRLEILDRFAAASADRAAVRRCYLEAVSAAQTLSELRRAARERQGREDMMRFQLKELTEARLEEIQPETLEGEVRLLRGAQKIRAAAQDVSAALDGEDDTSAAALVARASRSISALGNAGPDVEALAARLENLLAELRDTAHDANALSEKARSDPERLADLEDRRDRLRTLERKHGRDLAGLRELHQKLRTDLSDLEQIDAKTEQREQELAKAIDALRGASEKLSRKRKTAARDLEKRVNRELADLELKAAVLRIALEPYSSETTPEDSDVESSANEEARKLLPPQFKPTGAEAMDILFSANPELAPRPLQECASGGEISRVMLALKGVLARVAGADRLPVVVFDEIDSGVGGRLGAVLGQKLRDLARVRQVLCVTHQPQIAAFAMRQLKVVKKQSGGSTSVRIENLEGERRVEELALMLRGSAASAHTRKEAEAMLREAESTSGK
jgi:DNA repair protein RecN (Recombination protein N)